MLATFALLIALPAPPSSASPPQEADRAARPDFTTVMSVRSAAQRARRGELVRILIFPAELGGEDVAENVVFVTPAAAAARDRMIAAIHRLIRRNIVSQMEVTPEFRGDSVVPVRMRFHAWHPAGAGTFDRTLEIW